jgi:1-acyl-sn-glycerol-3-phosphate acyltransferase
MSVDAYRIANAVTKYILLPPYCRIRVTGIENVPLEGPLVIASNHLNDADPGIIATNFPRRIIYLAKIELFKVPVLGSFMRAYGALPVRRNEADLAALRRAAEVLDEGKVVCIFPEGTRSAGEARMKEAWPGAALIALRSNAPVLPIALTGSQELALPRMFLRPLRRYEVQMKVGAPFYLPRPARINSEAAREGTRLIMEHIAALLPPSYRGYYGEAQSAEAEESGTGSTVT